MMKPHHRRHSRYLLIALGMVGLVFAMRHMIPIDQEEIATTTESLQEDSPIVISKAPSGLDTQDIAYITEDIDTASPMIVISKPSTTVASTPSEPTADPLPVVQRPTQNEAPTQTNKELVDAPTQDISETIVITGSVGSGATNTMITIGAQETPPEPKPEFTIVTPWVPQRSADRTGRQFAYELADALDTGSGAVLTTIDGYYDTQTLYDARQQTNDQTLYHVLRERLWSEHQYDDLLELLGEMTPQRDQETPSAYLRALRESSHIDITRPETAQIIQDTLYKLKQTQSIADQDTQRYELMLRVWYDGVDILVDQREQIPDDALRTDIVTVYDYYASQDNVPVYYRDTLIAMALVQHGYFSLAEKIVAPITTDHPSYILPWQILAYSAFTQRDRAVADEYITQLTERDSEESDFYGFLRGVIAYWQEDYTQAALRLRQVQTPRYLPDTVRYLALTYDHLDDTTQRNQAYEALLQYTLEPSDYYTYFWSTTYHPFQEGTLTTQDVDLQLTKSYVQRCTDSLQQDARVVCQYGAAGVYLAYGELDRAYQALTQIYDDYPYSYIARALGDYYASQEETTQAMRYYYQALRSTDSPAEQALAKEKIWDIAQE